MSTEAAGARGARRTYLGEQSLEELLAEADRCMYERKRERAAQ
ncbi:MAG: hypothetical protein ACLP1X_15645 [Polyangiaceae bacterium]|jgi:hypothetical protein